MSEQHVRSIVHTEISLDTWQPELLGTVEPALHFKDYREVERMIEEKKKLATQKTKGDWKTRMKQISAGLVGLSILGLLAFGFDNDNSEVPDTWTNNWKFHPVPEIATIIAQEKVSTTVPSITVFDATQQSNPLSTPIP